MQLAGVLNKKITFAVMAIFALIAQPFYLVAQSEIANAATANITQLNFTTAIQNIEANTASAVMTIQTQNSGNLLESLDTSSTKLLLSTNSATGEFSENGTSGWTNGGLTLTMASGTANKSFYYRDSTPGTHTITGTAADSTGTPYSWTAAIQNIVVDSPATPVVPTATYTPTPPPTKPAVSGEVIYDSTPDALASNSPSLGYQATQTSEFGDKITFAGTGRELSQAAITLSSWACESGTWNTSCTTTLGATFSHPITLNIYEANEDGTVGNLIASRTQTFSIPYRPTSDPTCSSPTAWRDTNGNCFNGINHVVLFDLSGITVPNTIIYGIAFNTQSYGDAPAGSNGPYNALNVSLATGAASVGTNNDSDEVYWDSTYPGRTAGFASDSGWSTSGNPAVLFTAVVPDSGNPGGGDGSQGGDDEEVGGSGGGIVFDDEPTSSPLVTTSSATSPLTAAAFNPIFNVDFAGTASSTEGDVLGTTDKNPAKKAAQTDVPGVDKDGKILGLTWQWWLAILAGVAAGLWWLFAALRRRNQAE